MAKGQNPDKLTTLSADIVKNNIQGKKLSSAGAMFDPIKMRWYYGNTSLYASTLSEIFKNGYEDPTYLTFRVEFGDWGASVLDKTTFAGINESGTILNALHLNYDELPMGLLDLHSLPSAILDYNYFSFNYQQFYNAHSYLMHRNEDKRAEYLNMFIKGIYEVQKETPYIFLNIQGLDTLSLFNPQTGMRLKDATITIECIEGLSLKMKTLMELYRKAAWDDEWQRWVLPENMREFKMIIYVYERRTFHKPMNMHNLQATGVLDEYRGGYSSQYDNEGKITWKSFFKSIGDSLLNVARTDLTSMYGNEGFEDIKDTNALYMSRDEILNRDIPMYAFECAPCEFVIENHFANSYDAGYTTPEEKTTIKIKVKKVRTYYKNGLLNGMLGNIMIYDLIDALDRETTSYLRSDGQTLNSRRYNYLNKSILLENEDMHKSALGRFSFGLSRSEIAGRVLQYWSSLLNWSKTDKKENNFVDTIQASSPDANKTNTEILQALNMHSLIPEVLKASWWQEATVVGSDYWKGKNVLKQLGKLLTSRTTQVRTSSNYRLNAGIVYLDPKGYLDYTESRASDFFSRATELYANLENMHVLPNIKRDESISKPRTLQKYDVDALSGYTRSRATSGFNPSTGMDGINSSALTGGDESWATVEYDANGNIKGNDFTNTALYEGTQIRTKSPWSWNVIDSETLSGHQRSKGTRIQDGIKERMDNIPNVSSGAVELHDKIEHIYDFNAHTATKSNMDNPYKDEKRHFDTSMQSGEIDSSFLTHGDLSWATHDKVGVDYVHIDPLSLDNISNTARKIHPSDLTDSQVLKTRELPKQEMPEMDNESAQRYYDMVSTPMTPRNTDVSIADTSLIPREIKSNIHFKLDDKERRINSDIHELDTSIRAINNNMDISLGDARKLNDNIEYTTPDERKIFMNVSTGLDNTPRYTSDTIQEQSIDNERILDKHTVLNVPDDVREIKESDLAEVQLKERDLPVQDLTEVQLNGRVKGLYHNVKIEGSHRTFENNNPLPLLQEERNGNVKSFNSVDLTTRDIKPQETVILNNTARDIKHEIINKTDMSTREIPDIQAISVPLNERIQLKHNILEVPDNARELHDMNLNTPEFVEKTHTIALNRIDLILAVEETTSHLSDKFNQIDKETREIEEITRHQLLSSDNFRKIDVTDERFKNDKNLTTLMAAKALTDDKAKDYLQDRISKLLKELKQQTITLIRDIKPEPLNTLDLTTREQGEHIILPVEQVERIKENAILAGVPSQEVRKMSYKGMITLELNLTDALDDTVMINAVIENSKRTSATDVTVDERTKIDNVRIVDDKPRPRLGHKKIEKTTE